MHSNPLLLLMIAGALVLPTADKQREVMWVSLDESVHETVRVVESGERVSADGLIVRREKDASSWLKYRISCDRLWQVNRVEVSRLDRNDRSLVLNSDTRGRWTDERGRHLEQLDGCRDVDIFYSPFTNTIAIRRMRLKKNASEETRVVFISVPDLTVTAVPQRYTHLEESPEGSLYRYEGLSSGFSTELPVDADGLVIEYPKFFRRVWAR